MLKKLFHRINRHYVSHIDKALRKFDQSKPASPSQRAEIKKYEDIYYRRDIPTATKEVSSKLWEKF